MNTQMSPKPTKILKKLILWLKQQDMLQVVSVSIILTTTTLIFKAIFIVNDAGDNNNLLDKVLKHEEKLKDINERIVFDIVSTQMAIHYLFESEDKLRAYFKNVTDRLEPGGYFIGTTIDSDELIFRIRENGNGKNMI